MATKSSETRESLFRAYESTIVSTKDPADGDPTGAWTDPALVCVSRGAGARVMTAWNPGFDRPTPTKNEAANIQMRADLELAGNEVWLSEGAAPDGDFSEPGFLVWGMNREVAVEIARKYCQFAIYEYDNQGVRTVVPC